MVHIDIYNYITLNIIIFTKNSHQLEEEEDEQMIDPRSP